MNDIDVARRAVALSGVAVHVSDGWHSANGNADSLGNIDVSGDMQLFDVVREAIEHLSSMSIIHREPTALDCTKKEGK